MGFFFWGNIFLSMFFPLSLHHKSNSRVERKKVIESFQILSWVKKTIIFGSF